MEQLFGDFARLGRQSFRRPKRINGGNVLRYFVGLARNMQQGDFSVGFGAGDKEHPRPIVGLDPPLPVAAGLRVSISVNCDVLHGEISLGKGGSSRPALSPYPRRQAGGLSRTR